MLAAGIPPTIEKIAQENGAKRPKFALFTRECSKIMRFPEFVYVIMMLRYPLDNVIPASVDYALLSRELLCMSLGATNVFGLAYIAIQTVAYS